MESLLAAFNGGKATGFQVSDLLKDVQAQCLAGFVRPYVEVSEPSCFQPLITVKPRCSDTSANSSRAMSL